MGSNHLVCDGAHLETIVWTAQNDNLTSRAHSQEILRPREVGVGLSFGRE